MPEEIPNQERIISGDSLHYDEEGNAVAVCMGCMEPVDTEFGHYVEVGAVEKSGLCLEVVGPRWFWHTGCYNR